MNPPFFVPSLYNHMQKHTDASALGYAITFLLLVGLVCSGVLFIASVNKRIELNYSLEEHLVFDNLFAINSAAQRPQNGQFQYAHPSGDTSEIMVRNWGAFRVVVARTHHHNRSLVKSAIIGNRSVYSYATVYLPDTRQTIKVCGDTRIEGTVYAGERAVERGYITGKNYTGEKLVYGETKKSEKYLPELIPDVQNLTLESYIKGTTKIDFPQRDTTFTFGQPTQLVSSIDPIIVNRNLSGNLIIHSFDSIFVNAGVQLENLILIAPKVRFEKGFRGSVQVVAHEEVHLEEDVKLIYPSTVTLNEISENSVRVPRGIYLQEGSLVVGGILLVSQKPNFRAPLELKIDHATVGGLIYNVGETEVRGKVHGYIYTNGFSLRAGGGEYKNHLLDAEINSTKLPEELLLPQWIKHKEPLKGELITWF